MSELIDNRRRAVRWQVLTTVSAIALTGFSVASRSAGAADTFLTDSDHPPLWIELGGDFDKMAGMSEPWIPPAGGPSLGDAIAIRKDPTGSFGLEGKVSYWLDDWIISVSARYGRAQRDQSVHSQTGNLTHGGRVYYYNAETRHTENHLIADFQVGKDVGLGLWSKQGHSEVSVGLRIAQFNTSGDEMVSSNPHDFTSGFRGDTYLHLAKIERRTSALGPSLSWNASVPLVSPQTGHLALDWGATGALLFGRQKFSAHIKSNYVYYNRPYSIVHRTHAADPVRRKSVVIPNVAAFAGLSYNLSAAKIAIGYRADLYFNAVDGGVTAAHSINRSFYGPFATISVGIGG